MTRSRLIQCLDFILVRHLDVDTRLINFIYDYRREITRESLSTKQLDTLDNSDHQLHLSCLNRSISPIQISIN